MLRCLCSRSTGTVSSCHPKYASTPLRCVAALLTLSLLAVRCPHCRHFAPTYEKLAKALKDDPDILVTRLDVTDESIPEDILMAFPVRLS